MFSLRKLTTIAVACVCALGITTGTYIVKSNSNSERPEQAVQGISTVSYDNSQLSEYADQIASLVNKERASYGLKPVKVSPKLSGAANIRAKEIKQLFSHTRPDGSSCFTAITEAGITYRSAAENIAYGQKSPQAVMTAWMNSEGHRVNILNANMEYIGVGVYYSGGTYYWSQFFAVSNDLSNGAYLPDGSGTNTTTKQETTTVTEATMEQTTKKPEVTKPPVTEPVPEVTTPPTEKPKPDVTTTCPRPNTQPESTTTSVMSESDKVTESVTTTVTTPCDTNCEPTGDCYDPSDCIDGSCDTYNDCYENSCPTNNNGLDWILPWLTNNCDNSSNNNCNSKNNNSCDNSTNPNGWFVFGNSNNTQSSNCPWTDVLWSILSQR